MLTSRKESNAMLWTPLVLWQCMCPRTGEQMFDDLESHSQKKILSTYRHTGEDFCFVCFSIMCLLCMPILEPCLMFDMFLLYQNQSEILVSIHRKCPGIVLSSSLFPEWQVFGSVFLLGNPGLSSFSLYYLCQQIHIRVWMITRGEGTKIFSFQLCQQCLAGSICSECGQKMNERQMSRNAECQLI